MASALKVTEHSCSVLRQFDSISLTLERYLKILANVAFVLAY
jgi:hypothetical protein